MSGNDNCYVEPMIRPIDRESFLNSTVAILAVSGMGCANCVTGVRNGLLSLEGVWFVEVQLESGIAAIAFDPHTMTSNALWIGFG